MGRPMDQSSIGIAQKKGPVWLGPMGWPTVFRTYELANSGPILGPPVADLEAHG